VAVLAYLADVSWDDARKAIFGDKPRRSYRTSPADVVRGLRALGLRPASMLGERVCLCRTRHWKNFMAGRGFAAVFVRSGGRKASHWVAWEKPSPGAEVRLMDPADGLFIEAPKAGTCFGMSLRSHFALEDQCT
jgi:hypothetical protein